MDDTTPKTPIPKAFTQWRRSEDGWSLSVGEYVAVIEFMPEDALFLAKVNSAAFSAELGFTELEDAFTWAEEEIAGDCSDTIRHTGEAKLARFIHRVELYPELAPAAKPEPKAETSEGTAPEKKAPSHPKTVCVDLDATLFHYDRWRGVDSFGAPLDGAKAFLEELHKRGYYIMIHTARVSPSLNPGYTLDQLVGKVKQALKLHDLRYDEIWSAEGKPPAYFYVDDRAIRCRPQDDRCAFDWALEIIK